MFISYTLFFPGRKEQIAQQNEQRNVVETATRDIRNLALPDGSTITLNKYSSVAYSGAFVKKREMVLKGEAFFNVVQNKTNPFIITVDELKIRVVGTSFNVRNLSDGGGIEVQVETGVVKMYTAQNELTVKKGETGLFNKAHGELELKDAINVNSLGYATKTFSFNDLSFVEACRYLEPAFNVIIKIDPNKFSDCRLTAQFNNQSLDYILEIINATLNCSYKKQGNTIYIIGEGCK
jgi:ferric-dicitrate binding protein FerR (iron transport regulator)